MNYSAAKPSETPDKMLMCSPSSQLPLPGSVERLCSECGGDIWISKSMYRKVDAGELTAACIPCAATRLDDESHMVALDQAQLAELAEYNLLDFAYDLVSRANDRFYAGKEQSR